VAAQELSAVHSVGTDSAAGLRSDSWANELWELHRFPEFPGPWLEHSSKFHHRSLVHSTQPVGAAVEAGRARAGR